MAELQSWPEVGENGERRWRRRSNPTAGATRVPSATVCVYMHVRSSLEENESEA